MHISKITQFTGKGMPAEDIWNDAHKLSFSRTKDFVSARDGYPPIGTGRIFSVKFVDRQGKFEPFFESIKLGDFYRGAKKDNEKILFLSHHSLVPEEFKTSYEIYTTTVDFYMQTFEEVFRNYGIEVLTDAEYNHIIHEQYSKVKNGILRN